MENTVKHKLKLNIPRTITVGLAFFTISMFWQVYDNLMPLFLLDFDFGATARGAIMALDNILAVVLLPFMGILSDRFPNKLRSKIGRRMPFIICGSVLASATFLLVNYAHNAHNLALMLVMTAFVLVFMCLYRTPAVSLMPDVTPKPIRSTANAVINIMGTAGGVITLILMTFLLKTEPRIVDGNEVNYIVGSNWTLVSIISGMMVLAVVVMLIKVRENKFYEESLEIMRTLKIIDEKEEAQPHKKDSILKVLGTLSKSQLKSLLFLLLSVMMWFMAYNAMTTHFSVFALHVLGLEKFTLPLLIANAAAFIMYIPSVEIGKRFGRKKAVMFGVLLIIIGLAIATPFLIIPGTPRALIKTMMYPTFICVGGGWATINVHSFVMVVELSDEKTTGTYTGLYYACSMTAQIITPIIAGAVMDYIAPTGLIPYALVFACLALLTMSFVRHGNAQKVDDAVKVITDITNAVEEDAEINVTDEGVEVDYNMKNNENNTKAE